MKVYSISSVIREIQIGTTRYQDIPIRIIKTKIMDHVTGAKDMEEPEFLSTAGWNIKQYSFRKWLGIFLNTHLPYD
jgi:hypothetical protein